MKDRFYLNIIFRTCDSIQSLHSVPRPFGLDKKQLIKACFKSLVTALGPIPHSITVLGDKLSADMSSFFLDYRVKMVEGNFGNDLSIKKSIDLACGFPKDEWVYFCEDDYLHRKETFVYIKNFIENWAAIIPPPSLWKLFRAGNREVARTDVVIFPTDYPDRYQADRRKRSYIFVSSDCHWRQVTSTTFTFMAPASFIKKNRSVFDKASHNADDGLFSRALFGKKRFYNKALCLSPIPSLTAHMHTGVLPALIDWEPITKEYL